MELNTINSQSTWGKEADNLNKNFQKVDDEMTKLQNATYKNKGYFSTAEALKEAFPTASVGSKAYVGTSYPYGIWVWEDGVWADSGKTGGEESLNLNEYIKEEDAINQFSNKAETDEKLTELESDLSKKVSKNSRLKDLTKTDLLWEYGHISDKGSDSDYDYEKRLRTKGYIYLNGGDCLIADSSITIYIYYYNDDFTLNSFIYGKNKLYSTHSGLARILLIPSTDNIVGWSMLDYIDYVPYNYSNRVSIEDIDERLANVGGSIDFAWENGHINTDGFNASYDETYRIRSKMIYVTKGDIVSLTRFKKERYIIFYYNNDKTLASSSNWIINNTKIQENGFIRILMCYEENASYTTLEALAATLSIIKGGNYPTIESIEWELGGVAAANGYNYNSDASVRTSSIIHVKAGTTIVPYVFGRFLIAFYDDNGNFIERLPNDGEGEHEDGYFSQNAYEFTEDVNVRFILFWMTAASFYLKEGYENIVPNTVENLPNKFRIIPPKYDLPYYVKKEIDARSEEILAMGDMFRLTFITDPHEYYYHENAAIYCAEKNSNILVTGGDWLSWPSLGAEKAIRTVGRHMESLVKAAVPVVATKGNHEMSAEKDENGQTAPLYNTEVWYSQVQKPLKKANYQYDDGNAVAGYFFADDENNKVRIICLNLFLNGLHLMGVNQRVWLMNTALDLSSKGDDESNWSVIMVGHSQLLDNVDPDEPTATREEEWLACVLQGAYNKTVTILTDKFDFTGWSTPDFSEIKYQFVAYICGHSHYDNVSREKDFPHITTTCAHPLENVDKYRREWDTITEYAFDVMCLDTENRNLIIKRIGAGSDRVVSY